VEVGALIAHGLGVEPEYAETDWDSILAGVDTGRFDIACNGVGYTESRAEKYSFSTPYVYTHMVLVVRKDNEEIKTMDDLQGKKTANSASSTYAAIAEEHGATVTYVSTLGETMALLEQGRVDATVNAQESVLDYLKEHPEANIKIVEVLPGEPVACPVRKGEDTASLLEKINEILAAAREDGSLAAISEKYFGLDLTQPE
jgi:cystine transport system substrate-binding protein